LSKRTRKWIWIALLVGAIIIVNLSLPTYEEMSEAARQNISQR
jgi:hypothetical protein